MCGDAGAAAEDEPFPDEIRGHECMLSPFVEQRRFEDPDLNSQR